jgi:hypothetical protein
MMRVFVAACTAVLLTTGCSSKPSDDDVKAVLNQHLPTALASSAKVEQVQWEDSVSADHQLVKFKAVLKTAEPMFAKVEFDDAARDAGGDTSLFEKVTNAAQALSPAGQARFQADVADLTQRPQFVKVTTPAGAVANWYGSFTAKKIVDKWVSSDFLTDAEPKVAGLPRASFDPKAVDLAQATKWFRDVNSRQVTLLTSLADAKTIEEKDVQLEQQKAAADRERSAKESLMAAETQRARRMPIQAGLRPAALGGTFVLQLAALRPMTVRLDVQRDLQHFSRDLQVAPGRRLELGHLEGWGFKSGDQVTVSNPAFDPLVFTVR